MPRNWTPAAWRAGPVADLLTWAGLVTVGILVIILGAMIVIGRRQERAELPPEAPAICAWCQWRAGDDCTAEGSPVAGGECGPVCAGRLPCKVRQERG